MLIPLAATIAVTVEEADPLVAAFAGGIAGAVLDASDYTRMYQTDDTSTPATTTGQNIGLVQASHGGYDASQAASGSRPVLTDAGGVLCWQFDNTDDWLASTTLPTSGSKSMVVAGYFNLQTANRRLCGWHNNSSIFVRSGGVYFDWWQNGSSASVEIGTGASSGFAVISVRRTSSGASSVIRLNGSQVYSGNLAVQSPELGYGVGARDSAGGNPGGGRIAWFAIANTEWNDATLASLEAIATDKITP